MTQPARFISFAELNKEAFRLFFPAAVLTGIIGVLLWPLHFGGIVALYPGTAHAHLMAHGFFGGFIFGVLGTGLPRMLSAPPFHLWQVLSLLILYFCMVAANLLGQTLIGDTLLLILILGFASCAIARIANRKDLPPPGFILVALALISLVTGTVLSIFLSRQQEPAVFWINLQHLLSYQGFIFLPILGVGAFLLPRFFDLPNVHEFPESRVPPPGWRGKALGALLTGVIVIASFLLEAAGWTRVGPAIRATAGAVYLFSQVPIYRSALHKDSVRASLAIALVLLFTGYLWTVFFPANRVAVLHLTLVGGFAVITFAVATRVLFGHSGNLARLTLPNHWLKISVALMILGMATRISGDFFPRVLVSHYNYGAVLWIAGALLWSIYALPKVLLADPDD
jgi:uncharacterized protein involved in response to NO